MSTVEKKLLFMSVCLVLGGARAHAQSEDFSYENFSLNSGNGGNANASDDVQTYVDDFPSDSSSQLGEENAFSNMWNADDNVEIFSNEEELVGGEAQPDTNDVIGSAPDSEGVQDDVISSDIGISKDSVDPIPSVVQEGGEYQNKEAVAQETVNDFVGVPPLPGGRRIMASGEAPNEYKVEAGDTLFDICDQLIDEADYWPKLWALNPEIKNPHFIFPGMRLKFYPGDKDTPPFLQVINDQDIVPISGDGSATLASDSEIFGDADIQGLLVDDVKNQAVDIVEIEDLQIPVGEEGEVQEVGSINRSSTIFVHIPAFITKEEISPLGTVVGGSAGQNLSSEGAEVIATHDNQLAVGTTYSVVRPVGEIYTENQEFVGFRYEHVANVKVADELPGSFAQVRVTLSRLGVQGGDLIVGYRSTRRSLPMNISASSAVDASGVIVGFEHSGQRLGGKGSIVFVRGQLSAGSVVPVYQLVGHQRTSLYEGERPEIKKIVGYLHIFDTVGATSVGYAIKANHGIKLGDAIGKG